jgi:hypothetical protein
MGPVMSKERPHEIIHLIAAANPVEAGIRQQTLK